MPASDLPAPRPHERPSRSRPLADLALKFSFTGVVLGLFAAVAPFQGCKAGVGQTCRCATDCKGGLVCQAVGKAPLNLAACGDNSAGCCYPANSPGQCGEGTQSSEMDDALTGPAPEDILDMGSKRDLAMPDDTGESQGGSSGSTGATTTTSATTSATTTSATSSTSTSSTSATTSATTDAATTSTGTGSSGTSSGTDSSGTDSATGSSGGSSTDTE